MVIRRLQANTVLSNLSFTYMLLVHGERSKGITAQGLTVLKYGWCLALSGDSMSDLSSEMSSLNYTGKMLY